MTSLVLTANGEMLANSRASHQRFGVVRLRFGPVEKAAWIRAVINDDVHAILHMSECYSSSQFLKIRAGNGKSALMVACKRGSLTLARKLASAGADMNEKTDSGETSLMFAVLNGHLDIVRWLKDQGANLQTRDQNRSTPFLRAVEKGHRRIAKLLLESQDIDVNDCDENRNTALHYCFANDDRELLRMLLEHGADPQLKNSDGLSGADLGERLHHLMETRNWIM
ncbi:MAG: ankyrin repeat domain-containing protein [Granulosicoccus sp.]